MARRRKSYGWDSYYPTQASSGEIRARAERAAGKARKAGKELCPVRAEGRNLVNAWWGLAWCRNLERYADYSNRIPRGKRYIRAGAVLDLQIEQGTITASVQGSRRTPYKVQIHIQPLSQKRIQEITERCVGKIQNLEQLVSGTFPQELQDLFTERDGLFPTPREIRFSCSCPDWASMCKHVAAALYGVGVRLDTDPKLFFELRGIDWDGFLSAVVVDRVNVMLKNADRRTDRVIDEQDLSGLFGLEPNFRGGD